MLYFTVSCDPLALSGRHCAPIAVHLSTPIRSTPHLSKDTEASGDSGSMREQLIIDNSIPRGPVQRCIALRWGCTRVTSVHH
jgi:hypothetical protein